MKRALVLWALLLAACGAPAAVPAQPVDDDGDAGDMASDTGFTPYTGALYVEPSAVRAERAAFKEELAAAGRGGDGEKRELYERYIGVIGANGVLEGIQELWPGCHSEAHALGYVIYDKVKDVGTGLQVCADGCYSGCMHGVLMEAFGGLSDPEDPEGHVDLAHIKEAMDDVCFKNDAMRDSYSPGDCAHGVGHAVMYLADYDVPQAVGYCKEFDDPVMDYYCATGAYMEYVTENDRKDAITKPPLYPCTGNDFPAACARYKMVHVVSRHYLAKGEPVMLLKLCNDLKDDDRIACFHGLGNAHMTHVFRGTVPLGALCLNGTPDDNRACIEGVMERMSKYHNERAKEVCTQVAGTAKEICDQAVQNGMYSMTKDMSLYLRKN